MGLPYYLNVKRPEGLAAQAIVNYIYLIKNGQEEEVINSIEYVLQYLVQAGYPQEVIDLIDYMLKYLLQQGYEQLVCDYLTYFINIFLQENYIDIYNQIILQVCPLAPDREFIATQRTFTAFDKFNPQLQVMGNKIFYTWAERDSNAREQIWTAVMDIVGENFTVTKRTTSSSYKNRPQFHVVDDKIYFVWDEWDGVTQPKIWTAVMNIDGSGFTATQRFSDSYYSEVNPQLYVFGDKIYYVWIETDDDMVYQIKTATMNLDGSGFSAATATTGEGIFRSQPQLQVYGNTIYYLWVQTDEVGYMQLYIATMSLYGGTITITPVTNTTYSKENPQFQIINGKIYYIWIEKDNNWVNQVWTGVSNLDGTGFVATKRTSDWNDKVSPQLQVEYDKIYYVWQGVDSTGDYQVWTAESNLDGTGFVATKRTNDSGVQNYTPQLQVVNGIIYYVWTKQDSSYKYQIWTGVY